MQGETNKFCTFVLASAAVSIAALAATTAAQAGGLAIREQSAQFQGSSFAGNGAGGGLSSAFWNSATIGEVGHGLTTESGGTVLYSRTTYKVQPGSFVGFTVGEKARADRPALLSNSYQAFRLNDKIVVGLAINAPFGIATELDDPQGSFRFHHRAASILTLNANPMASMEVMPGLFVGVGAQVQYIKVKFKVDSANAGAFSSGDTAGLEADDIGYGFTAGLLFKPNHHTSIGIGFRSMISHKVKGDQFRLGTTNPARGPVSVSLRTPEMVTASLRQEMTEDIRLLATVEWTNWDRLGVIPILGSGPLTAGASVLDFQWHDGWFFALGGEFDYSEQLTFRAGAAYEISPIQNATERLVQVPDADRIWVSAGGTFKLSHHTAIDFSYTHVFVEDTKISRVPASPALAALQLNADADTSADILSIAVKMKWGDDEDDDEE